MRRGLLFPALFTLASLAILLALGLWQWQRRDEKAELISTIQQRITAEARPLDEPAAWPMFDAAASIYRPVTVSGVFDHANEAHVFFALSKPKGGFGGPGYVIITPLQRAGGGVVLVNRGFAPQHLKSPATRRDGQIDGLQTITGLIRAPEKRLMFSGTDNASTNTFYVRDPATLALAKGLGPVAPFIIDLQTPAPSGGLPVPGITLVDLPNNHLQYALTWWSLAAILAVIFLLYARQNPR